MICIAVSSIERRMTVRAFLFFLCHSVSAGSEGSAEGDLPEVEEGGGMVGMGRVSSGSTMDQILRPSRTVCQRPSQFEYLSPSFSNFFLSHSLLVVSVQQFLL